MKRSLPLVPLEQSLFRYDNNNDADLGLTVTFQPKTRETEILAYHPPDLQLPAMRITNKILVHRKY